MFEYEPLELSCLPLLGVDNVSVVNALRGILAGVMELLASALRLLSSLSSFVRY